MIGSLFVLYMKKLPWLSMVDHKFNFKIFKNFQLFLKFMPIGGSEPNYFLEDPFAEF